jgi:hypothetical protein
MGTCGLQTQERQTFVNRRRIGPDSKQWWMLGRETRFCIVSLIVALVLAACAPTIKYGSPPKVNQLSALTVGSSTKSDVLAAFGEPRGYGVGHYAAEISPREIWFYDYMESDGVRTDLKFLLVFFDADRYDGHLWFSSSTLLDTGE